MLSESAGALHTHQHGGLNPCFSGICSLSLDSLIAKMGGDVVLILVLVEYAL